GSGWSAPEERWELAAETSAWLGRVAIDSQGRALALTADWVTVDETTRRSLRAHRYTPTGGWEDGVVIDKLDHGGIYDAYLAMNTHGDAVAVFAQDPTSGERDLLANRYIVGQGWGAPV